MYNINENICCFWICQSLIENPSYCLIYSTYPRIGSHHFVWEQIEIKPGPFEDVFAQFDDLQS